MSLFGDMTTFGVAPVTRARSGSSVDEMDTSVSSVGSSNNASFSTERFEHQMKRLQHNTYTAAVQSPSQDRGKASCEEDDAEWDIISKKIDSCVRLETQFFEYPTQDIFSSPPGSGNIDDDELKGTKVFLGGMRFEVVQMGRHMVSWLLEAACGVRLPFGRILIHRKSRNGKTAAPTGCASVYVADDDDVQKLIAMNQRVFCGVRGLHVAASPERMAELIQSKTILDIVEGRVRGPTHPMIIEKAYASAAHSPVTLGGAATPSQGGRIPSPQHNNVASPFPSCEVGNGSFSSSSSLIESSSFAAMTKTPTPSTPVATPITLSDGSAPPVYFRYEGDQKSQSILADISVNLVQPLELFVGGLCYEATRTFVAWVFSLIDIRLHPQNVTLYVDPQTGVKRGCAQVKIEEADFGKANGYTRRLLCDPYGVYIAESPQGIIAVQQSKERTESGARGPTHAVVIERRRNTQRHNNTHSHNNGSNNNGTNNSHSSSNASAGGFVVQAGGGNGPSAPPPPPPPMFHQFHGANGGTLANAPMGRYVVVMAPGGGGPPTMWAPPPPPPQMPLGGFTSTAGVQFPSYRVPNSGSPPTR